MLSTRLFQFLLISPVVQSACISTLKRIRGVFLQSRNRQFLTSESDEQDIHDLAFDIKRALFTFEHTSNHAVMRVCRLRLHQLV